MTDDRDLGGDPACWAHLVDELDEERSRSCDVQIGDLTEAHDGPGSGAIWSLRHGGDLDANIVRLEAGGGIAEHVNDEVDVLLTVWSGSGSATVDGRTSELRAGVILYIGRGAPRTIEAGAVDLLYLSVHRRRDGLRVRPGH